MSVRRATACRSARSGKTTLGRPFLVAFISEPSTLANLQINNDIHEQGANAGRIFIPPYMDPVEPNIDSILTAGTNSLGSAMSWRMIQSNPTFPLIWAALAKIPVIEAGHYSRATLY